MWSQWVGTSSGTSTRPSAAADGFRVSSQSETASLNRTFNRTCTSNRSKQKHHIKKQNRLVTRDEIKRNYFQNMFKLDLLEPDRSSHLLLNQAGLDGFHVAELCSSDRERCDGPENEIWSSSVDNKQ
ncbi:hypothetical protein ATANTOWER_015183 [Ataeniobius toweri]|uniref:Uncharacterized protein n=1 Tax=Ataeniobius toweri TaxID=208326 RepID=A0ABU7CBC5_9TELE|nr:hypothetical protein [Ataeniobius toweri]